MSRVIDLVDTLVTPADPVMTVDYAADHIRAIDTSEDTLIAAWIEAATEYFQGQTGRQIGLATREVWMDRFPYACGGVSPAHLKIELPRPPLQSVVSVSYVDGNGDVQTFDDGASPLGLYYQTKAPTGTYARRGWVEPIAGRTWPQTRCESGAVRIRYTCGYTEVPPLITGILCLLVAHFDQNRLAVEAGTRAAALEVPLGVSKMLEEFKYASLPSSVPRVEGYAWP